MIIKPLYRYEREPGKFTVATEKPDCEYEERYRVIADEKMLVTQNGTDLYSVIDTDIKEGWYEVDEPVEVDEPEEL